MSFVFYTVAEQESLTFLGNTSIYFCLPIDTELFVMNALFT